jgi:Icc-related predicted phosphoesterase
MAKEIIKLYSADEVVWKNSSEGYEFKTLESYNGIGEKPIWLMTEDEIYKKLDEYYSVVDSKTQPPITKNSKYISRLAIGSAIAVILTIGSFFLEKENDIKRVKITNPTQIEEDISYFKR